MAPEGNCACGHDGVDHHPHNSDPPDYGCLAPGCPCQGFESED